MKMHDSHNSLQSWTVFLVLFFFCGSLNAQSALDINDPNIIYKDRDGNLMSKDSLANFVSKGNFGMMKKDLGNGKMEIRLIPQTKSDNDERAKTSNAWISKWIDKPFPDFNLLSLSGKSTKLSDLYGNVVVINFWFTGCKPFF